MTRLSDAARLERLRLIRSERVGPLTFRGLMQRFGSAGAALEALPGIARARGGAIRVATLADAERELAGLKRLGAELIAEGEPGYPKPLAAIEGAPPLIAVRGSIELLSRPTVAIVGSRNASAPGLTFADKLARAFGAAGLVVASGLARGIDTRAHRASLESGTVAVLAGGHDRVYPSENGPLVEAIIDQGGAVITEMPLGYEPRAQDFPRRNRLVSGLSLAVVVAEAARRSGSLITARYALEQGREVFAVPGSPLDPRTEGTNDLIRQGASLCSAPDQVIAALQPLIERGLVPTPRTPRLGGLDEPWLEELFTDEGPSPDPADVPHPPTGPEPGPTDRVLGLIGFAPTSADELARLAGLPIRIVQNALLELELAGRIRRDTANGFARA
jgi:DNA processing protein